MHASSSAVADADLLELQQLAYRYAAAADTGDVDAFRAVFHAHGRLRVYHPDAGEPFAELVGHDQLGVIPPSLRTRFRSTAHQMMNHLVDVDGDMATGSLLCTARHLNADLEDRSALVVVIRYVDRYERRDGPWRITDRQVRFLWSETHPVMVDSGF
jgi:hypothetical protein